MIPVPPQTPQCTLYHLLRRKRSFLPHDLNHPASGKFPHTRARNLLYPGIPRLRGQMHHRAIPQINAVMPIPRPPYPYVLASCHDNLLPIIKS